MNLHSSQIKFIHSFACIVALSCAPAFACDPCALFSASRLKDQQAGIFTLSMSEQFTDYERGISAQPDLEEGDELVREYSTTQFSANYDFTNDFGLQLTLPFIARRFDRVGEDGISTESDSDLGDLILAANLSPFDFQEGSFKGRFGLTAGVKFPTGNTSALGQSTSEGSQGQAPEFLPEDDDQEHHLEEDNHHDNLEERFIARHHPVSTASGGRVLVFGSGSYDYIIGLNFVAHYQRFVSLTYGQYTIRTEGDFNYQFGNDLLWGVSSGYYLWLNDDYSIAGLVALSGELKSSDEQSGELVADSDVSNLYLGPQLILGLGCRFSAELAMDFRVTDEDPGSTVVPDTRVRAAVAYRFS